MCILNDFFSRKPVYFIVLKKNGLCKLSFKTQSSHGSLQNIKQVQVIKSVSWVKPIFYRRVNSFVIEIIFNGLANSFKIL